MLVATWRAVATASQPAMVVIEGPAGIGKTRLARHLRALVEAEGHLAVWGRSHAHDGRPFGPLADVLAAAIEADPTVVERIGPGRAGLVPLVPHLADRAETREPDDDTAARTRLFGAVRDAISEICRDPTLVVLDDLHWAGEDTLALLEASIDGLTRPLMVVVTARPTPSTWASALASIQRRVPVETIRLGELSLLELAELIAGHPPPLGDQDVDLATRLHARTAGLPFFAAEIARAARTSGTPIDPTTIPGAVRDWIARRVTALPPALRELIERAAGLGLDADTAVLERSAPTDRQGQARHVDELIDHGLLADGDVAGRLTFSHAITRDVVYDDMGPTRRLQVHRRLAEAISAGPPAAGRSAVLAHHYRLAGPELRGAAAAHAWDAGQEALSIGAWDQAAVHFEHSLESSPTPVAQARALIGLGRARLRQRRFDDARRLLNEAVEVARAEDLPYELGDATLALVGRAGRGASPDRQQQVTRLRTAIRLLERVDPAAPSADDSQRRSVLLSQLERELAVSLLLSDAAEERVELFDRAVARARSLPRPDPSVLAAGVLALRMRALDTDTPRHRLAHIDEVLDLPARRLAPDLLIAAQCYRHEDLLQLGDRAGAEDALAAAEALVERYPDPYWRWATGTWRALGCILDGDLDGAETLAFEAHAHQPGVAEATACLGVNLIDIRLFQGRAGEVADLL